MCFCMNKKKLFLANSQTMVNKNAKDTTEYSKSFKELETNRTRIRWKDLILFTTVYVRPIKQGHTLAMMIRKWLSTIECLQSRKSLYHQSLSYQIFTNLQRHKRMVNYYFWTTLNKWQKKRNYIKHNIRLIIFRQVQKQ